MSNTCPKCGAEESKSVKGLSHVIFYRCASTHFKGRMIDQSQWCYGRAEAIAELDAWHTGEPPEGVRLLVKGGGAMVIAKMVKGKLRVDGLGPVTWNPDWQWREVRP